MRNYPIQTLLFWKTKDYIKTRKFMDNIESDPDLSDYYDENVSQEGKEKTFVLDGQQRLQSLFAVFDGSYDDKEFYINILTGEKELDDNLYYEFRLSKRNNELDLPYFKLKKLIHDNRNAEDIADEVNTKLDEILLDEGNRREREKLVRRNISQITSLIREDKHFWFDELDGIANKYTYNLILNIFIRVNSGGTKLDAADLMFAAMKEAWSEVEENIESVIELLNNSGRLNFDKTMVLKGIMLVLDKGAILTPDFFLGNQGDLTLNLIEQSWPKISDAFTQLRDFIQSELMLYSDKVVRSYNALIPIFEYFYYNPSPDPINRAKLKSYYYRAQLFNWFSARTDQILNSIHGIFKRNLTSDFPLDEIKKYFKIEVYKEDTLKADHLRDARLRYIFLNMIYVEYTGTSPFNVAFKMNEPHIDHIYPKSKLKKIHPASEINNIGNYRFVGAADNIRKRAELPDSYFKRLKAEGVDIKRHLLLDDYTVDPDKLTINNYNDFRNRRLDEILKIGAKIVNK
jgi:hypothetical protein